MRHKIFSLFLALIASLSMIKAEIPTVADLAEKYDVENNVVFCIQFIEEAEVCNDVVMKVNSNSWDQLLKFAPIPEFEGWYALEVPYNELFEGQIFIIASNGELNKEYQTGDKDAWVHVDGLELSIDYIQFTYVGEWFIHVSAPGAYIYQLKYWKDHVNPCATQQIGDLFYLLDKENKTAQVTYQYNTGYNYSGLTAISIPTSVTYNEEIYDVTGIGEAAFNYCSSLTSIEIPNSVTNIGNSAFLDCIGFTSIDLPNSVTSIGECAFCYCRNMISFEIPNSVTSIGNGAFNGCTSMTSITIGNSVTSIGRKIFDYCPSLTDIYATCGDLERVQQLFNNDSRVKYKPLPFTITTNAVNGTIESPQNICEQLIAVPDYGYHFVQWSDGVTDNPRSIELTQDTIIAAEFAPNKYTISVTCDSTQGYIDGVGEFDYLTENTFEAIPNYGYHFAQWSDGNTDNPRTITIIQDTTFQAIFAKNTYSITKNAKHGTIAGNNYAEYLDEVILTVNSDYGYHFAQWSDGNTDNPRTFVLTQDTTFTAELAFNQYSISVTCDEVRGSIEGENGVFDYLTEKTYEAIPNYGYHFAQWSDGNTDNPRTITITKNISISAVFAKNTYTIIDKTDPTQGYIYGAGTYEYLDEISLTPVNEYGYHFVQWSDDVSENPRTIVLTQDTTFAAEFEIDTTGVCGDELALTWTYNSDSMILIIRGEGSLNSNYTFGAEAPNFVEKLIFEEGVTTIGNSAFYGLSTINEIHFASSIKTIHEQAFYNCINLSTIFNYRNTPAVVYSNTFDGIDKFSCTLYVPATSLELYRSATGWRDFYYTKAIDDDQAIEITNDQLQMTNKIFIDNQIFILRGDKTYTLTGQQVK